MASWIADPISNESHLMVDQKNPSFLATTALLCLPQAALALPRSVLRQWGFPAYAEKICTEQMHKP